MKGVPNQNTSTKQAIVGPIYSQQIWHSIFSLGETPSFWNSWNIVLLASSELVWIAEWILSVVFFAVGWHNFSIIALSNMMACNGKQEVV